MTTETTEAAPAAIQQAEAKAAAPAPPPDVRDSQPPAVQHAAPDQDWAAPSAAADGESGAGGEPDEPVKYRVSPARRERVRAGLRADGAAARALRHDQPIDPRRGAGARRSRWAAEDALLDLVAGPASGITRLTVAGASAERVARLEQRATARGLPATGASSPSLRRGWIKIRPPDAAVDEREVNPNSPPKPGPPPESNRRGARQGARPTPLGVFARAVAWLRGGLRRAAGFRA